MKYIPVALISLAGTIGLLLASSPQANLRGGFGLVLAAIGFSAGLLVPLRRAWLVLAVVAVCVYAKRPEFVGVPKVEPRFEDPAAFMNTLVSVAVVFWTLVAGATLRWLASRMRKTAT